MKRLFLMLAAFFTFSTALVSCRDTERETEEVELETTMDDDINTNNDLNGTTRGEDLEMDEDNTTTSGTNTNL